jgi:hypothetical protein
VANPQFPTDLATIQDSKYYHVKLEDEAMRTPMEGGYVVSRARTTRAPRHVFTTGFTDLTDAQKSELDAFFGTTTRGGSVIFDWVDPASGATFSVRFGSTIGGDSSNNTFLDWKYTGMGSTRRWDVQFDLEEA